jgi:hypothetical protein
MDPLTALSDSAGWIVGKVFDGDRLWGYLHVHLTTLHGWRKFRKVTAPAMVEEMYRVLPPAPDDFDWADELGWSDTVVTGDHIRDEMSRLQQGKFLLGGRTLCIEWLDGDEATTVEQRYFSDPEQ